MEPFYSSPHPPDMDLGRNCGVNGAKLGRGEKLPRGNRLPRHGLCASHVKLGVLMFGGFFYAIRIIIILSGLFCMYY